MPPSSRRRPSAPLALLAVLALAVAGQARAASIPEPAAPSVPAPSPDELQLGPHARDALRHAGEPDAPWTTQTELPESLRSPSLTSTRALALRVYGYLPYWVTLDPATFRWETITDLIIFGADLTSAGTVSSWHGWPQTALIQAAHAQGKKAVLGVLLFNSSAAPSAIATFLASASAKSAAISTLVAKVKAGNGDGLNLDFEFVPSASRDAYSTFVEDLSKALKAALPDASLTLAVPPGLGYRGYDAVRLSAAADRVLIMFYDYHWSSSPATGPVAPLTKGGFWGAAVATDLDAYLGQAPPAKIAMGVPYYGNDWPAATTLRNAATTGTATAVVVRNAIPNAAQRGRLWDVESQTPWYLYNDTAGAHHQCWYDDDQSLALKFRLARSKGLGGAMIWALGYDTGRPEVGDALMAELGVDPVPTDGGSPDSGAPDAGPGPGLTLTLASFTPSMVRAGELVNVELHVKNTGTQTLSAAAPPPDTVYDESQSSTGSIGGTFRLAVDADGRASPTPAQPWRWGLPGPLAPGADAIVTGQVRLNRAGQRNLWASVVLEGTGVSQEPFGTTSIDVLAPDAGAPDGGPADPDGGRDPGSPGQTSAPAESGGCTSAALGTWAFLSLLATGLLSRRRR